MARVRYIPNSDRSAYFVEVEIGWMGKPILDMPEEFWRGTGYSASLSPRPRNRGNHAELRQQTSGLAPDITIRDTGTSI